MRHALLAISAALLLGGCNMVITNTPTFDASDAVGAAPLKPGVWSAPKEGCAFDEKAAVETWPDCANGGVITDTGTLMGFQTQGDKRVSVSTAYVLAMGDPRVFQVRFSDATGALGLPMTLYFYLALKPTAFDDQSEITGYRAWFIMCGPPPAPGTLIDGKQIYGTLKPLAGLTMDPSHDNCSPASKEAVRAAAGPSEQWQGSDQDHPMMAHWVRAGSH